MLSRIKWLGLSAVALATAAAPAFAGEITGSGKDIELNSRSICAFSGYNDTPEGQFFPGHPEYDPGGIAQSFGFFGGFWDLWDAEDLDPHEVFLSPGFACNPNRGPDLNE